VFDGIEQEKHRDGSRHDQPHQDRNYRKETVGAGISRRNPTASWSYGFTHPRNAFFTSGLDNTTRAQIPMGKPMMQQGEMHGIIATMLAAMAKP